MSQRMLIDARHPEETRVAVVNGNRIEEFDFEAAEKKQLKGNIYLAKVTRVEPSLQAAFVEYGGNRHGFLAFSEIHPDYYQIPKEDREALIREEAALGDDHHDESDAGQETGEGPEGEGEIAETGGGDDAGSDVLRRQRQALRRRYKIQEVIRRRQVVLIQVVKEERGNKGAALTTYLSLAGRFSVLMPNTAHGGGISRKISNLTDRKRLKSIMADLQLPAGMGAIVRTAGLKRTKVEIKRDFDYLTRLWDEIRETTLASVAPCLVHQDSDLIKRAIRDIYTRDIEQVLVDGEAGFEAAQTFMNLLMPAHAKKVVHYSDPVPLFQRFGVEGQLAAMYHPVVQLRSGGYIVINPTEALVSIDINSGRSTREHGIEETAFKTNMEAAEEIGRQLRLRDMAGLVVIDFIDMEVNGNNRRVERAMKEALKNDRARIQLGRISSFGLMEMSRQRLRTGVLEASTHVCPMCDGSGYVRSVPSAALAALRDLEAEAIKGRASEFTLRAGLEVAMYILNRKRGELAELEARYEIGIETIPDESLMGPNFVIDAAGPPPARPIAMSVLPPPIKIDDDDDEIEDEIVDDDEDADAGDAERAPRARRDDDEDDASPAGEGDQADRGERSGRGRRRRRRGGGRDRRPEGQDAPLENVVASGADDTGLSADPVEAGDDVAADGVAPLVTESAEEGEHRRRRRGRRGGRRREGGLDVAASSSTEEHAATDVPAADGEPAPVSASLAPEAPADEVVSPPAIDAAASADETAAAAIDVPAKKPRRSRAKKPADIDTAEAVPAAIELEPPVEAPAKPARRPRRKAGAAPAETEAVIAEPETFVDTAEVVAAPEATDVPAQAAGTDEAPARLANDAEPAADVDDPAPDSPRKGGWWQRTFGN
ncbi:MAG: Rne/Rng family ribonuclease [Janthinobacterium lividum]